MDSNPILFLMVEEDAKRSITRLVSGAGSVDAASRHHAAHGARNFLEGHHRATAGKRPSARARTTRRPSYRSMVARSTSRELRVSSPTTIGPEAVELGLLLRGGLAAVILFIVNHF
jgi:hypothetical protein